MGNTLDVGCPTCFAIPGELCRSRFLLHGERVTPVVCVTHPARSVHSQREYERQSLARQLLALALMNLRAE